jgi:hypothetical protein
MPGISIAISYSEFHPHAEVVFSTVLAPAVDAAQHHLSSFAPQFVGFADHHPHGGVDKPSLV